MFSLCCCTSTYPPILCTYPCLPYFFSTLLIWSTCIPSPCSMYGCGTTFPGNSIFVLEVTLLLILIMVILCHPAPHSMYHWYFHHLWSCTLIYSLSLLHTCFTLLPIDSNTYPVTRSLVCLYICPSLCEGPVPMSSIPPSPCTWSDPPPLNILLRPGTLLAQCLPPHTKAPAGSGGLVGWL